MLLPHRYTYPRRKVLFGFKVRCDLHVLPGQRVVPEVSLQGVTCQLEVHLLLLTTLRAKHPLPHIRIIEMPSLSFTGTTAKEKKERGDGHKKCQKGGQGWMQACSVVKKINIEHTKWVSHFRGSIALWGRALEATVSSVIPACREPC